MRVDAGDGPIEVTVHAAGGGWTATVDGEPCARAADGFATATDGDVTWVGRGGSAWGLRVEHTWRMDRPGVTASADGLVTSPMPGSVLDVRVEVGDSVHAGQTLAVVEAMKMEHPLTSRIDGVVAEVLAHSGQQVGRGDPVVRVEAEEELNDVVGAVRGARGVPRRRS